MAAKKPSTPAEVLAIETLNPRILKAEYAVRGEIVRKAAIIENELASSPGRHPFSKVVWCNIGNPQLLGQKPVTYFRQVLALVEYPEVGVATLWRSGKGPPAAAALQPNGRCTPAAGDISSSSSRSKRASSR